MKVKSEDVSVEKTTLPAHLNFRGHVYWLVNFSPASIPRGPPGCFYGLLGERLVKAFERTTSVIIAVPSMVLRIAVGNWDQLCNRMEKK